MQKQCKHFWMLLEEYSKAIDDDRNLYRKFYCAKCLKTKEFKVIKGGHHANKE